MSKTPLGLVEESATELMTTGDDRLRVFARGVGRDGDLGQVGHRLLARDELAEDRVIEIKALLDGLRESAVGDEELRVSAQVSGWPPVFAMAS